MKIKEIIVKIVISRDNQKKYFEDTYRSIIKFLKDSQVSFSVEKYDTYTPKVFEAELVADGKNIPCKGSSFVSGHIDKTAQIFSSLHSTEKTINISNIQVNMNSLAISRPNFYFAPSVSIAQKDISQVKRAKTIEGRVGVKKVKTEISQILIGNLENPRNIIFSHYDSIDTGALDNGSGVGVCLALILAHKEILEHSLFVIDGNEELSYDFPTYWGHGYRVFERRYRTLLKKCKKIIIVDCVGNGKTHITSNKKILKSAFPIKSIDVLIHKTCTLHGDVGKLLKVYHSNLDTTDRLYEKYLRESMQILNRLIK